MKILNAKIKDTDSIRKLWDECFDEDSQEWRGWYFENIHKTDNVLVAKNDDELISMVHMNPYPIMLRGTKIEAFALSGVATYEKHRGQGYAAELIKHALKKAYAQGYAFSFLYPFMYEYYEKFGYGLSYHKYKHKEIYLEENAAAQIKVCERFNFAAFSEIYNNFVSDKNGYVIRDSDYYTKHIKQLECDENKIICFTIGNDRGYYCIDKEHGKIEEMAFEGDLKQATTGICSHEKKDTIFENLFKYDKICSAKEPHCMGRVISVEKILGKMKLKNVNINLKITDYIIKENNGVWHIQSHNGQTTINKVDKEPDYIIDICMLAPIITGINVEHDEKAVSIQQILFRDIHPFIYEVC